MVDNAFFSLAEIHVNTTGEAGVETSHRSHDVDSLEPVVSVFLEDRAALHGVFIRTGRSIGVARTRVPWGRRVGMVIRNHAFANDQMVREDTSNGFMEAAADGLVGDTKIVPGICISVRVLLQRLFAEI